MSVREDHDAGDPDMTRNCARFFRRDREKVICGRNDDLGVFEQ